MKRKTVAITCAIGLSAMLFSGCGINDGGNTGGMNGFGVDRRVGIGPGGASTASPRTNAAGLGTNDNGGGFLNFDRGNHNTGLFGRMGANSGADTRQGAEIGTRQDRADTGNRGIRNAGPNNGAGLFGPLGGGAGADRARFGAYNPTNTGSDTNGSSPEGQLGALANDDTLVLGNAVFVAEEQGGESVGNTAANTGRGDQTARIHRLMGNNSQVYMVKGKEAKQAMKRVKQKLRNTNLANEDMITKDISLILKKATPMKQARSNAGSGR